MVNINFVPDDYVQSKASSRTNLVYLVLLLVVMTALGVIFTFNRISQRACNAREKVANQRLAQIQEDIKQFEELQTKRKVMMKTALTTTELLEPIPRSVLLASLTNNLPAGVSLLKLSIIQKEPKNVNQAVPTSKYKAAQAEKTAAQDNASQEKLLETNIEIGGVASSDLQVAAYMERLGNSSLLDNVALIESKEYKVEEGTFRQFKLTAMLRKDLHLTQNDIERIRTGTDNKIRSF